MSKYDFNVVTYFTRIVFAEISSALLFYQLGIPTGIMLQPTLPGQIKTVLLHT